LIPNSLKKTKNAPKKGTNIIRGTTLVIVMKRSTHHWWLHITISSHGL